LLDLNIIKDKELLGYCKKVLDVNLALSDFQEDIVLDFLTNIYSGYQQLADALCDKLLKNRIVKGIPVPIDNVKSSYHNFYNTRYNTNTNFFDEFEDVEVLKEAFVYRWKEKNAGSDLKTFDEIAPIREPKGE